MKIIRTQPKVRAIHYIFLLLTLGVVQILLACKKECLSLSFTRNVTIDLRRNFFGGMNGFWGNIWNA